jgi:mannose-6-phosphate isomerase-like protein (cupin superfamily)
MLTGFTIAGCKRGEKMRTVVFTIMAVVALFGMWGDVARGQGGQAASAAVQQAAAAPKDKAAYFGNQDLQSIWKDLEARQVINKRVLEGGAYSINIRIVKEGDAPLVHASSADVWVMTAGTATAITGGQLVNGKKRPNVDDEAGTSIRGGVEQALKPGDVLYVPPGVAHGFKDVKGFRAFLIRFDTK